MRTTQATASAPVTALQNDVSSTTACWLVTVKVLAEVFAEAGETEPAIRANMFKAEDRVNSRGERIPGNGLAAHGAIIKRGRKRLIDVHRYGNWLAGKPPVKS